MKKLLFAVVLTSLLVFAGCASGGGGGGIPKGVSGSGTGTALGFGGNITVTVTVVDGKITQVEAVGPAETQGMGSIALTRLPSMMVDRNTIAVNVVSGATYTSNGVLEAAKIAVDQIK